MPPALLDVTPRTSHDDAALDALEAQFFETDMSVGACVSTCVSGLTLKCDGKTFNKTCVSGWTLRCDG
jgi:hypothetical protein